VSDIKTFSQALPILEARGLTPRPIGGRLWMVGAQTLDKSGVVRLAREKAAAGPPTGMAITEPPIVGVPMMDEKEARGIVNRINARMTDVRNDLIELEDREGWKALGYDGWRACVEKEFGKSASYLYRQLVAGRMERDLDVPIGTFQESHLRTLAMLDTPDQQRAAIDRADELAGDKPRTAKHLAQAAAEIAPAPFWQSMSAHHPTAHLTPAPAPEQPLIRPATCIRCGSGRTETRSLTSYQVGLIEAYPGRAVTLCSRCIPELLHERAELSRLDQELPKALSDAGYYWHAATPPTIAHNDGWKAAAETVEAALALANERMHARPAAARAIDWPAVAGESHRLGASRGRAEAWAIIGNIIGYLSRADTGSAITWLLGQASALTGERLEEMAADLDDATYEALAAYRRAREPTLADEVTR